MVVDVKIPAAEALDWLRTYPGLRITVYHNGEELQQVVAYNSAERWAVCYKQPVRLDIKGEPATYVVTGEIVGIVSAEKSRLEAAGLL